MIVQGYVHPSIAFSAKSLKKDKSGSQEQRKRGILSWQIWKDLEAN